MIEPNKTSICNEYELGICIDKTIECSINVQNQDAQTTGIFEIEVLFVEKGKARQDAFDSKISIFSLGPNSDYLVNVSTQIQSPRAEGLADKKINCFYNAKSVPKREEC